MLRGYVQIKMCGINGFNFEDEQIIRRMNDRIRYRGPDAEGIFCNKISLGHVRLKIIDLSENARQPMSNENGGLWIIFNGEIYNFQELRKELEQKHRFKSKSDTEVILHAYEEWGNECVNKFNGMWAFCIYDKKKQIFFLSRDRLGKKPLHYYCKNEKFIFSSEIKAILEHGINKELNKTAVSSFLSYRYVLGEETFFKNIFKLLPAHNMIYNLKTNKIERIWEYWDLPQKEVEISEEKAEKEVEKLLMKSVEYRKISDVPLGVILSGGLDSSLITALLATIEKKEGKRINTFTVKFPEEGFDETKFAKIVAKKYNTNYFEVKVDISNFLDIMKEYTKYKDEPIGVPNEIALYLLARKIKENVTVVLSGEGADELFAGYRGIFSSYYDYERLKSIKERSALSEYRTKFKSLHERYGGRLFDNELQHFLFMYNYWTDDEKNFILKEEAKKDFVAIFKKYYYKATGGYIRKISYLFLKLHLPTLLNRLDNPTMANAVEGRVPLLDYKLAEYAYNLPSILKIRWKNKEEFNKATFKNCEEISENYDILKYVLKKISLKYLPESIIKRKKQGFPLPLDKWFRGKFLDEARHILLSDKARIKEVIDQKKLEEWIDKNLQKQSFTKHQTFGQKLWMLVSLEFWLEEWFPRV